MPLWFRQILYQFSLRLLRVALLFRRLGLTGDTILFLTLSHFVLDLARGRKRRR